MAVSLNLKIEGMDDVIKALREAADKDLRKAVYDVGKKTTKKIQAEAKANCPVDKDDDVDAGNLRDSIKTSNSKKKLTFSTYTSNKKAPYAMSVEYGHKTKDGKDVDAQPFLVPAGRKHEAEFEREMTEALLKVAKKVVE